MNETPALLIFCKRELGFHALDLELSMLMLLLWRHSLRLGLVFGALL